MVLWEFLWNIRLCALLSRLSSPLSPSCSCFRSACSRQSDCTHSRSRDCFIVLSINIRPQLQWIPGVCIPVLLWIIVVFGAVKGILLGFFFACIWKDRESRIRKLVSSGVTAASCSARRPCCFAWLHCSPVTMTITGGGFIQRNEIRTGCRSPLTKIFEVLNVRTLPLACYILNFISSSEESRRL